MPPTSYMRKPSTTTTTTTNTTTAANNAADIPRTSSGRAIRHTLTRPSVPAPTSQPTVADPEPPGFFPALQFFSDAITALPREVVKQFTLMKEVEAKVSAPNEKLGELLDSLMQLEVPCRAGPQTQHNTGLLSLTTNNSAIHSATASLVNGVPGDYHRTHSEPSDEASVQTRKEFLALRQLTHTLLPVLDEKSVVLAAANRVLAQQLVRVDSVLPALETEISDEARLGSMTHWAYTDNRVKKASVIASARAAAGNALASLVHAAREGEIAQVRREAVGIGRGKRKEMGDSDFDGGPVVKKGKNGVKGKVAAVATPTGLGITNGEVTVVKKRRVVEKSMATIAAPAMERSASGKGKKAAHDGTPRSTPATDTVVKRKKTVVPSAKARLPKGGSSAHNSPAMASSPLHSSFATATVAGSGMEAPPPPSRLRQNSIGSRPVSSAGKHKPVEIEKEKLADPDEPRKSTENASGLKREESTAHTSPPPRTEAFPLFAEPPVELVRTKSVRQSGKVGIVSGESSRGSSSEPLTGTGMGHHRRGQSNSHLVKQLMPFNRSPDADRHRGSSGEEEGEGAEGAVRKEMRRRTISRRNTGTVPGEPEDRRLEDGGDVVAAEAIFPGSPRRPSPSPALSPSPAPAQPAAALSAPPSPLPSEIEEEEEEGEEERSPTPAAPELTQSSPAEADADIEADDDSDGDPDDPNEDKYCYCNRGSYGEMVACDNAKCAREWFHLQCTGLEEAPGGDEEWFCDVCRPEVEKAKEKGKGGRGRRGGK